MSRKLLFISGLLCILALGVNVTQATLVGYWNFNEGQGTVAGDSSGNGHNGTINGTPQWVDGPPGFHSALLFGDTCLGVACGQWNPSAATGKLSISCWIKFVGGPTYSQYQGILADRTSSGSQYWAMECSQASATATTCSVYFGSAYPGAVYGLATLTAGQWAQLIVTFDGSTVTCYVNGTRSGGGTTAVWGADTNSTVRIGASEAAANTFRGAIDDVRFYDNILSTTDITALQNPPTSNAASSPSPANGTTDVQTNTGLSWVAGTGALTHDVYFGTSLADVNAATKQAPGKATVSAGLTATSLASTPIKLSLGTAYYWRVDEVNASTTVRGDIWCFGTEPISYVLPSANIVAATASSTNSTSNATYTKDGSGMTAKADGNDVAGTQTSPQTMWLTVKNPATPVWISYQFDRAYKISAMWVWNYNDQSESDLGYGIQNATISYSADGQNWTTFGDVTFQDGPGDPNYYCNNKIDMKGIAAQYVKITAKNTYGGKSYGLAEVRFFWVPTFARTPVPASGTTGIDPTAAALSWRPGREAVSHSIYTGTDPNALTQSGTSATASFTPANLVLGTRYYWRVDEVGTGSPSIWTGDSWYFNTADFLVVDNFESYGKDLGVNTIFDGYWSDGYVSTGVASPTNGALVGYDTATVDLTATPPINHPNFLDASIVNAGGSKQSLPFRYGVNKSAPISEITLDITKRLPKYTDWTAAGVTTLTLYFYGDPANAAAPLYVKINDTKVPYAGDTSDMQRARWNPWNITLASVSTNLKSVTKLTIGVTGPGNSGMLLIDDIRLYKTAPAGIPTAVDPGTNGLVAYYSFTNNVKDSSGKANDGTIVGAPTYVAGLSASNMAMQFNGTADCVDLGKKDVWNPTGSFSVAFWANITAWGTAWGHVMVSNRGETDSSVANGWQIRRGASTGLCWTTRGIGGTDDLTGSAPTLNQWVHVTCVFDQAAATKTLYINGLSNISGAVNASAKITATTTDAYIGARSNSGNTGQESFFTGMIDEVRVFNRALTGGEANFLSKP